MGLLNILRQLLGGSPAPSSATEAQTATPPPPERAPEPEPISVPEIEARELLTLWRERKDEPLILLDCREGFERWIARIPDSLHIPMGQIPRRLEELDREAEIIVYCAHGNRSYSVAGFLIQNGFRARSLKGGIAEWQALGGEIARGRE